MAIDENFFVDENAKRGNFGIREMVESNEGEKILWEGKPDKKSFVLGRIVRMMPIALI